MLLKLDFYDLSTRVSGVVCLGRMVYIVLEKGEMIVILIP